MVNKGQIKDKCAGKYAKSFSEIKEIEKSWCVDWENFGKWKRWLPSAPDMNGAAKLWPENDENFVIVKFK